MNIPKETLEKNAAKISGIFILKLKEKLKELNL
jgi:hypothetical protein